jgi:hypothetical protein
MVDDFCETQGLTLKVPCLEKAMNNPHRGEAQVVERLLCKLISPKFKPQSHVQKKITTLH